MYVYVHFIFMLFDTGYFDKMVIKTQKLRTLTVKMIRMTTLITLTTQAFNNNTQYS